MLPPVVGHLLWSGGPVDCFHDGARLEQHGQGKARTVWCAREPCAPCSMQKTIERYCMYTEGIPTHKLEMEQHMQHMRIETESMVKKIEFLEVSKRKLLGQGLGSCSVEELQEIDSQLEQSLKNIRARKAQLYKEQIQELKAKCDGKKSWQQPLTQQRKPLNNCTQNNESSEVETELLIGLPRSH
ncbi:hypothetical protein SLEP1_g3608 [Rubroshorea leprosula]|uniref:K-box domain-containing protein n=1 Tax=Rubroshorea leprosula TaxID=152421 RepID=A0AAV5HTJ5_9ROSI|nr:hypothetical protein SLEP1_g3608 [Rubroshorea leprosula]